MFSDLSQFSVSSGTTTPLFNGVSQSELDCGGSSGYPSPPPTLMGCHGNHPFGREHELSLMVAPKTLKTNTLSHTLYANASATHAVQQHHHQQHQRQCLQPRMNLDTVDFLVPSAAMKHLLGTSSSAASLQSDRGFYSNNRTNSPHTAGNSRSNASYYSVHKMGNTLLMDALSDGSSGTDLGGIGMGGFQHMFESGPTGRSGGNGPPGYPVFAQPQQQQDPYDVGSGGGGGGSRYAGPTLGSSFYGRDAMPPDTYGAPWHGGFGFGRHQGRSNHGVGGAVPGSAPATGSAPPPLIDSNYIDSSNSFNSSYGVGYGGDSSSDSGSGSGSRGLPNREMDLLLLLLNSEENEVPIGSNNSNSSNSMRTEQPASPVLVQHQQNYASSDRMHIDANNTDGQYAQPLVPSPSHAHSCRNRNNNDRNSNNQANIAGDSSVDANRTGRGASADASSRLADNYNHRNDYYNSNNRSASAGEEEFSRLVSWSFHEMNIAVESSLNVYSVNEDHPSIAVRPLEVPAPLTPAAVEANKQRIATCCLDYYLDNVIANVPELALCLHSKGLLNKVHVAGTADIPYLPLDPMFADGDISNSSNSSISGTSGISSSSSNLKSGTVPPVSVPVAGVGAGAGAGTAPGSIPGPASAVHTGAAPLFDPSVVDFNASSILRFLKENCCRDGVTYIFKKEEVPTAVNTPSAQGQGQAGASTGARASPGSGSRSDSATGTGANPLDPQSPTQLSFELYDLEAMSSTNQKRWKWLLAMVSYRFARRLQQHITKGTVSARDKLKIRDRQIKLYSVASELLQQVVEVLEGEDNTTMRCTVFEQLYEIHTSRVVEKEKTIAAVTATTSATTSASTTVATTPVGGGNVSGVNADDVVELKGKHSKTVIDRRQTQGQTRSNRARARTISDGCAVTTTAMTAVASPTAEEEEEVETDFNTTQELCDALIYIYKAVDLMRLKLRSEMELTEARMSVFDRATAEATAVSVASTSNDIAVSSNDTEAIADAADMMTVGEIEVSLQPSTPPTAATVTVTATTTSTTTAARSIVDTVDYAFLIPQYEKLVNLGLKMATLMSKACTAVNLLVGEYLKASTIKSALEITVEFSEKCVGVWVQLTKFLARLECVLVQGCSVNDSKGVGVSTADVSSGTGDGSVDVEMLRRVLVEILPLGKEFHLSNTVEGAHVHVRSSGDHSDTKSASRADSNVSATALDPTRSDGNVLIGRNRRHIGNGNAMLRLHLPLLLHHVGDVGHQVSKGISGVLISRCQSQLHMLLTSLVSMCNAVFDVSCASTASAASGNSATETATGINQSVKEKAKKPAAYPQNDLQCNLLCAQASSGAASGGGDANILPLILRGVYEIVVGGTNTIRATDTDAAQSSGDAGSSGMSVSEIGAEAGAGVAGLQSSFRLVDVLQSFLNSHGIASNINISVNSALSASESVDVATSTSTSNRDSSNSQSLSDDSSSGASNTNITNSSGGGVRVSRVEPSDDALEFEIHCNYCCCHLFSCFYYIVNSSSEKDNCCDTAMMGAYTASAAAGNAGIPSKTKSSINAVASGSHVLYPNISLPVHELFKDSLRKVADSCCKIAQKCVQSVTTTSTSTTNTKTRHLHRHISPAAATGSGSAVPGSGGSTGRGPHSNPSYSPRPGQQLQQQQQHCTEVALLGPAVLYHCYQLFVYGSLLFDIVGDVENTAIAYCNICSLLRLYVSVEAPITLASSSNSASTTTTAAATAVTAAVTADHSVQDPDILLHIFNQVCSSGSSGTVGQGHGRRVEHKAFFRRYPHYLQLANTVTTPAAAPVVGTGTGAGTAGVSSTGQHFIGNSIFINLFGVLPPEVPKLNNHYNSPIHIGTAASPVTSTSNSNNSTIAGGMIACNAGLVRRWCSRQRGSSGGAFATSLAANALLYWKLCMLELAKQYADFGMELLICHIDSISGSDTGGGGGGGGGLVANANASVAAAAFAGKCSNPSASIKGNSRPATTTTTTTTTTATNSTAGIAPTGTGGKKRAVAAATDAKLIRNLAWGQISTELGQVYLSAAVLKRTHEFSVSSSSSNQKATDAGAGLLPGSPISRTPSHDSSINTGTGVGFVAGGSVPTLTHTVAQMETDLELALKHSAGNAKQEALCRYQLGALYFSAYRREQRAVWLCEGGAHSCSAAGNNSSPTSAGTGAGAVLAQLSSQASMLEYKKHSLRYYEQAYQFYLSTDVSPRPSNPFLLALVDIIDIYLDSPDYSVSPPAFLSSPQSANQNIYSTKILARAMHYIFDARFAFASNSLRSVRGGGGAGLANISTASSGSGAGGGSGATPVFLASIIARLTVYLSQILFHALKYVKNSNLSATMTIPGCAATCTGDTAGAAAVGHVPLDAAVTCAMELKQIYVQVCRHMNSSGGGSSSSSSSSSGSAGGNTSVNNSNNTHSANTTAAIHSANSAGMTPAQLHTVLEKLMRNDLLLSWLHMKV